jgi:hypothetical protein
MPELEIGLLVGLLSHHPEASTIQKIFGVANAKLQVVKDLFIVDVPVWFVVV